MTFNEVEKDVIFAGKAEFDMYIKPQMEKDLKFFNIGLRLEGMTAKRADETAELMLTLIEQAFEIGLKFGFVLTIKKAEEV
jgi:hypothetical protein